MGNWKSIRSPSLPRLLHKQAGSQGLGPIVKQPGRGRKPCADHFACWQLWGKGHCVVPVPPAACSADDSKVSFGIKSKYQVGDGLAPSKGAEGIATAFCISNA